MSDSVILANISDANGNIVRRVSIGAYKKMLDRRENGRVAIAEMIYHRFYGRYIKPFLSNDERYRSGFAMMASACLLIEALESFYHGWEETPPRYNSKAFDSFFNRESTLKVLKGIGFYKNIRCGIMHQGETTGGFRIERKGRLFDGGKKTINAEKFLKAIDECLKRYRKLLTESQWDSEIWDNFRTKMRHIIKHCR